MNIYGGKITTYRKLAEAALEKVQTIFPEMGPSWTEKSYLPGGAFEIDEFEKIVETVFKQYEYLGKDLARRLVRLYGKDAYNLLANKTNKSDLGQHFGNLVYAFEIDWTIKHEWVTCSEDFLWRRTKLGLRLDNTSAKSVDKYIKKKLETILKRSRKTNNPGPKRIGRVFLSSCRLPLVTGCNPESATKS